MHAGSRSPLGKMLVAAQVAISLLLLIGAGLFVRTLINLQKVPSGFNQQNVMLFETDPTLTGYKDPQQVGELREVEEKVESIPYKSPSRLRSSWGLPTAGPGAAHRRWTGHLQGEARPR